MSGRAAQGTFWQPTWHTLAPGNTVYFPYTKTQWMAGQVIRFNHQTVIVQPRAGSINRVVTLRWGQVFWRAPDCALCEEPAPAWSKQRVAELAGALNTGREV